MAEVRSEVLAAAYVIVEHLGEPSYPFWMLYGFMGDGRFVGDTWHQSVADAENQAAALAGTGGVNWYAWDVLDEGARSFVSQCMETQLGQG